MECDQVEKEGRKEMRIFITGANRGLGYELTKLALKEGHTVFAGAYAPDGLDDLEKTRKEYPERLVILDLDVASDQSVTSAMKKVEEQAGALDAIVNNAGILLNKQKRIDELDSEELRLTFEINTFGPYRVLKNALPLLYKGENKMVINISSEASSITNVGINYCSYSMSKVALTMMSQMFANFLKEKGFKVYALHPGRMNTVMGKETAQIEPSESAAGILAIMTGKVQPRMEGGVWFINYRGEPMKL
jgi:NAD(P)-dependent dehydrogenase (short-subunit alcohol dehydrogenase family)